MARAPTALPVVTRNSIDYAHNPALGQAVVDNSLCYHLKIAVSKDNTDAQVLFTVPTSAGDLTIRGMEIKKIYWEVTADWTGGSSSAIGISSSRTGYSTKGDLLGGASGDVLAGLTAAAVFTGTVGAKGTLVMPLAAGDTIRFDRITSAFTAGTGFLHISGFMLVD